MWTHAVNSEHGTFAVRGFRVIKSIGDMGVKFIETAKILLTKDQISELNGIEKNLGFVRLSEFGKTYIPEYTCENKPLAPIRDNHK